MVFTLSAVPLFQQRHPLRVRIPASADDAVQIQGKTGIVDDKPTPLHHSLSKPLNMLTTKGLPGFIKVPYRHVLRFPT